MNATPAPKYTDFTGNLLNDIWMIHAQIIAIHAIVDLLKDEVEEVEGSEEFPSISFILLDVKAKIKDAVAKVDNSSYQYTLKADLSA